jgi:signal transduction histidine kinase
MYRLITHSAVTALMLICISQSAFSQEKQKIDSLKGKLNQSNSYEKLEILNELFKQYNQFDYEAALGYANEFDRVAKEIGDSAKIIEGGRKVAYSLMDLGKNDEAFEILIRILEIAERNKDKSSEIKRQIKFILNNAGLASDYLGNYDKALEYYFKSLVIREKEGDKKSISTALNNLGLVFYHLKDYKKAIEYYQRAIDTKKEISDKDDLDRITINLGLCHNQLGEFKIAIEQFKKGFALCNKDCSDNLKREGLTGLGASYIGTKDLEKAEESLLLSLEISKKQNNIIYQIDNLHQLSMLETARGNDQKALKYLNEALSLAETSDYAESLIQLYDQLSKIYSKELDFKKTAYYLGKYTKLKDSIYSEELIKNLAKVQTNFAERENIKTIKEKNEVLVLKDKLLKKQRELSSVIVAVTLIVLTFAFVLIIFQRKYSKQLKEVNLKLEEKVLERTQDLKKTNEKLDRAQGDLRNFLYKTSHDIRGPVATLKGLNNLGFDNINDHVFSKELLEKKSTQIEKMIRTLSRITVVADITNTILQAVEINFVKMMDEIKDFERKNGLLKYIKISIEVEPNLKVVSDPILIRMILENMVDNSLKFFNESKRIEPYVKISVKSAGSDAIIVVKDNGVGIEVKPNQDVFTMFMRGSEKSETGGVGLYLCKICTDRLQGSIKLEKTSKAGTIFSIRISQDATDQVMELNEALLAQLRKEEPPIIEFDQETNN